MSHTNVNWNNYRVACNWNTAQSIDSQLFQLDLIGTAKKQLRFLARVHNTPALRESEVLNCAVDRYLNNWLPLALKFHRSGFPDRVHARNDAELIPPLDCAWIWHCHKLNPVRYAKDCKKLFGELIDIQGLPSEGSTQKPSEQASLNWWWIEYPEEPYHFVQDLEDGTSFEFQKLLYLPERKRSCLRSKAYDLVAAANRQASFFFQVQRSWFSDDVFLEIALQRYRGFLYLIQQARKMRKAHEKPTFLVPTYDIDLIWHSHQLHPSAYSRDTLSLYGTVLNHDDYDSDRRVGKKLYTSFLDTCERWWTTYGTVYECAGVMYRGPEPPPVPPPPSMIETKAAKEMLLRLMAESAWETSFFDNHMTARVEETLESNLRSILQVHLVILAARIITLPDSQYKDTFRVCVTSLKRCPFLDFNTKSTKPSQLNDVVWNHGIALEAEEATLGLQLQLIRTRKLESVMGSSSSRNSKIFDIDEKCLGAVCILWSDPDLFSSNPGVSSTKLEVLTSSVGCVELQYSISVTPAQRAPNIFRLLQAPVTDDYQTLVLGHEDIKSKELEAQTGRWTNKTVVDHHGSPLYTIRTRLKHVIPHKQPKPLTDRTCEETIVKIHEGDYTQTGSRVLGTARFLVGKYLKAIKSEVRRWSLFEGGVALTVIKSLETHELDCELHGECGPHPMRLLQGGRLQYVKGGIPLEDKCLTLIRYTPDAPKGQATAFINLTKACIEVMPGESTVLVLMISCVVSISLNDLSHLPHKNQVWNPESLDNHGRLLVGNSDRHLGAIALHRNQFSRKWTPLDTAESQYQCSKLGTLDLYNPWWTHDYKGNVAYRMNGA